MKVSKSKASDNRDAILQAASAEIRSRGLDQTSIADVARASGLTHGALYSHFSSKDALTTEAMKCAFADCLRDFTGLSAPQVLKRYLSTEHRDNPEVGCPAAALVSEIARQPAELQAAFRSGVDRFVALTGESLEAVAAEHGRDRAVLMFAAMVGGLALSRAIRDVDAPGSADILRAVKKQLGLLVNG
jgi:TetR/AcrR family transcriptional regulator, transcriptional repressor for nem operon